MIGDPFQDAVLWTLLLGSLGTSVAAGVVAGRRRGVAIGIVAAMTMLVGLLSAGMAFAHLIAVIWSAAQRGDIYPYNFRFAALLLVGILLVLGGALCVAAVPGLAARRRNAWGRAASGALLLLIVSTPLIPVQPELAGGVTFLGGVLLVVLLTTYLRDRAEPRPVGTGRFP